MSAVDPALAKEMKDDLAAAVVALQAIQAVPFDAAIAAADGSPERENVLTAIKAVRRTATHVVTIGQKLGVTFKLEEPSEAL